MVLGRLFSRREETVNPLRHHVPADTRVYAIGDIHGRIDLLERLMIRIKLDAKDSQASRKVLVFLGDYIDRGFNSSDVLDYLIKQPFEGFETQFLLGNHEQWMLQFLSNIEIGANWLAYGGEATLHSYGVRIEPLAPLEEELPIAQRNLRAAVPHRHIEFLSELHLTHQEGDYLFVHAGIRPGTPLELQKETDLLWIREQFLRSQADHGVMVVHGHSVTSKPDIQANRIGIDTGAFASGILTALVLEGADRHFVQTD